MKKGKMKNGTVYYDYRDNIVIDRDNPILAFKANRDRYDDKKQSAYAGMPMIGSIYSEDALTWNVFRILQSENSLHLLNHLFEEDLTDAKLLLWTYACIRKIDGKHPGHRLTEPDVILLTKKSFIVCECKLGRKGEFTHLWESDDDSNGPAVRYRDYFIDNPNPFRKGIPRDSKLYSKHAYQLFRMVFYSYYIGQKLFKAPKFISITNESWWNKRGGKTNCVPSYIWKRFCSKIKPGTIFLKNIFWQNIWSYLKFSNISDEMAEYLKTHPSISTR